MVKAGNIKRRSTKKKSKRAKRIAHDVKQASNSSITANDVTTVGQRY